MHYIKHNKDKMFCWDVLVQLVWRNQFCQSSSPDPHPLAKVYDSKQDFLYATKSICDFSFFFFGQSLESSPFGPFNFWPTFFPELQLWSDASCALQRGTWPKGRTGLTSTQTLSHGFLCVLRRGAFSKFAKGAVRRD